MDAGWGRVWLCPLRRRSFSPWGEGQDEGVLLIPIATAAKAASLPEGRGLLAFRDRGCLAAISALPSLDCCPCVPPARRTPGGGRRSCCGRAFSGAPAQPHGLGEMRTGCRIGRSHHRIIAGQAPFLPVFFGRQAVMALQVPLEGFELLAVLKTNDVLRRYRFLDRHSGFKLLLGRFGPLQRWICSRLRKRSRLIRGAFPRYGIVSHVSRDDIGGPARQAEFTVHNSIPWYWESRRSSNYKEKRQALSVLFYRVLQIIVNTI